MSNSKQTITLSWPEQEADKLYQHWQKYPSPDGICRFETGYGPSGIPHLGTFSELKRTIYVINIFQKKYNVPTELICFSDDVDGLRAIPDNVPNKELLTKYLDYPIADIPDPFKQCSSFGEYMNNKMLSFLEFFNIK